MQDRVVPIMYLLCAYYEQAANYPVIRIIPHQHCHGVKVNKADVCLHFAKSVNWEENREFASKSVN